MPAQTLNGRLICAANCSYAVTSDAPLQESDASPYFSGAGFVSPPTGILGENPKNAALVGTISDGVVVAIRGTLPPTPPPISILVIRDWMNDCKAELVRGDAIPGLVHRGFLNTLDSFWIKVRDEVKRQLDVLDGERAIFITGHSKGGGVAPLLAWRFHIAENIQSKIVTFAAPRCGNIEFAKAFDNVIPHERFEFGNDIVPWVPISNDILRMLLSRPLPPFIKDPLSKLEAFDYEPTGKLFYIKQDLSMPSDLVNLKQQRIDDIVHSMTHFHFERIISDHFLRCGLSSGYMRAICPIGVCPK